MGRLFACMLAGSIVLSPAAWGQATLNKCIDAQGKVTYSNLPCKNAREAQRVMIDPPPAPPVAAKPAPRPQPAPAKPNAGDAPLQLETRQTNGKASARATGKQCDSLSEQLGRVLDRMDEARRKGYAPEQMNRWNEEVRELERKKQQAGCF
jgi:hypothetical protein